MHKKQSSNKVKKNGGIGNKKMFVVSMNVGQYHLDELCESKFQRDQDYDCDPKGPRP